MEETKRNRVEQRRIKLYQYLLEHWCVDCGEEDPVILEFDHVRGSKFMGITDMLDNDYSWKSISKEILKCDVRCCNCHRRRTAHKCGHWKIHMAE